MAGREYKVTIKSANQKANDYVVDCESEWTVYKLKQHIAITHENKPAVEEQRLIYAGRLLNDNHILRQIFFRDSICTDQNPDKADFTIHLVCAQPQQASDGLSTTQSSNRRPVVTSPPQSTTNSQTDSFARNQNLSNTQPDTLLNNSVRSGSQNHHQHNIFNNVFDLSNRNNVNSLSAGNPLNFTTNATLTNVGGILTGINFHEGSSSSDRILNNPHLGNVIQSQNSMSNLDLQAQQALFQQMAQLVASQLNQLPSSGSITSGTIPASLASQTTMTYLHHSVGAQYNVNQFQHNLVRGVPNSRPNVNLEDNRADANVVRDPAGVDFRNNAPNIDQAQPIQQHGNLEAQRHVLDWLYYTFRALILMTALYVHSSYKFIFVVCFMAFCYFYKKRAATRRAHQQNERRQVENNNNHNQALNNQAIHDYHIDREEYNNLRNRGAQVLNDINNNTRAQQDDALGNTQPGQEARLPFLKMIYMVVSSFIISLIPDNQADNQV